MNTDAGMAERAKLLLERESEFEDHGLPDTRGSGVYRRVRRSSWALSYGGRLPVYIVASWRAWLFGVRVNHRAVVIYLGPLAAEFRR